MKRLLLVSDAATMHTRRWAEYFRDRGVEVHVASFRDASLAGIEVHRLPTFGLGRIGYFVAVPFLRRLARRLGPDIVHAQYVTSYGFIAAAARLHPLVLTAWGTDVLISPQGSAIRRWLSSYAVRHSDVVTTVAVHMNPAVAALGARLDDVSAVPFGVDLERFRLPAAARPAGERLRIISTRNLAPLYRIDNLVDAVAALRDKGIAVDLDLVGDGVLRAPLEQQVARLGLSDSVRFHGFVEPSRLAELLGAADIFVTSAISDGNNVSLNEAMACGCFPIATDIPANSQWIDQGENGLLYPAGDAVGLAAALERAVRDPELRRRTVAVNRRIVETRADWRVCVTRMEESYRLAIARAAAGAP